MSLILTSSSPPVPLSVKPISRRHTVSTNRVYFRATKVPAFPVASLFSVHGSSRVFNGGGSSNFCNTLCGWRLWMLRNINIWRKSKKRESKYEFKRLQILDTDQPKEFTEASPTSEEHIDDEPSPISSLSGKHTHLLDTNSQHHDSTPTHTSLVSAPSLQTTIVFTSPGPSLVIAVIGATGELARSKIFPALFALYYTGYLPENVVVFGYSRKSLSDEDLRCMISSNLTCRIDHQQSCADKLETFLSRTFYLNGGSGNKEGMSELHSRMGLVEGNSGANRIFYLAVPQEALLDVSSSLAHYAQTRNGWNRVIVEKPFGFDLPSSSNLTRYLLSKFEEKQLYRIDHLLGRNIIENLIVLRFSNLIFQPLWNRAYIRNIQVILSEDMAMQMQGKYFEGYGVIRDIVHSHILQTIALLAMEPPISLSGEDIRNEKVKLLRSIRKLELRDFILGQYKDTHGGGKIENNMDDLTPTFFAAALFIDNARWDGVPFLIRTGLGLLEHRVEIRIQFRHVPGNLYREHFGHNLDLNTNELILREAPDEAILVKINNKIPGLGMMLDASELNLLYKDKYDVQIPCSYEQLLLDVIDGDNHLFMRSDEVSAGWNILSPVLEEIDKKNIRPEFYELGGRGPIGAYYLWAKHGVRWVED